MISKIFIYRPKFAFVISIVITLAGLISMGVLPVNMYPEVTPPQVQITAVYPGASAQVVEESVIRPIEEQLNGVEDMMYIESTASNNGSAQITVYFEVGTDSDIAQVNVQNRVALAESALPEEVNRQGVSVKKQSSAMLVGEKTYSMRIWLRPDKMSSLSITVGDVQARLREQNLIVAAGQWYRSYGNELWEFAESGLMRRRIASINDREILESELEIVTTSASF